MSINIEVNLGVRNAHRELPLTAETARSALRSLDGDDTSALTFERDHHLLQVGGGPDKFVVNYAVPDAQGQPEEWYSLVTDPEAKGQEERIVAGNLTNQAACELVSVEAAEAAAVEFAETGRINLTPEWLSQVELARLVRANVDVEEPE